MKIFLLLFLFGSLNSQQLHKNIKQHYKHNRNCSTYHLTDPVVAFDYWREDRDWLLPRSLQDCVEFTELHNYIYRQMTVLRDAYENCSYNTARLMQETVNGRLLLFLYNHPDTLCVLEYYKVKIISVSFAGLPVFSVQIYNSDPASEEGNEE